jgi:hypothetical protein
MKGICVADLVIDWIDCLLTLELGRVDMSSLTLPLAR